MERVQLFSGLLLLLAACGGVVNEGPESTSGSGGGGGGTTTTTITTGSGGGTTTTTTTTGGGPGCYESNQAFTMDLAMPNGGTYGCATDSAGTIEFEAQVVSGDSNGWTLDTCSPAADCIPQYAKLSVGAPDLFAYLPTGTYVRVRVDVQIPWGCSQMIEIDNISQWDGMPNPVMGGDFLWLAAADGAAQAFDGAPFGIESIPLGCYPNEQPGCGKHEDYQLRFTDAQNAANAVVVPMGQLGYLGTAAEYWSIKNLRSFETGMCDDYWNWAYWVSAQLLDGGG